MNCTTAALLLLFFLTFPLLLRSQGTESYKEGFVAQLHAGFMGSQIDGDRVWGYNRVGPSLGAGIYLPLKVEKWSLGGDVLYAYKGSRSTADDPIYLSVRLHYIEMPIYLKYSYNKKWRAFFGAGPAYFIGGQYKASGWQAEYADASSFVHTWDWIFCSGLDYVLDAQWSLQLRWHYSMTAFNDTNNTSLNNPNFNNWYNNSVYVAIRRSLRLRK